MGDYMDTDLPGGIRIKTEPETEYVDPEYSIEPSTSASFGCVPVGPIRPTLPMSASECVPVGPVIVNWNQIEEDSTSQGFGKQQVGFLYENVEAAFPVSSA